MNVWEVVVVVLEDGVDFGNVRWARKAARNCDMNERLVGIFGGKRYVVGRMGVLRKKKKKKKKKLVSTTEISLCFFFS